MPHGARLRFLAAAFLGLSFVVSTADSAAQPASGSQRVVILGFDGVDANLTPTVDGRRQAAEPGPAARPGDVPAAALDGSVADAGVVVDVFDRPRSRADTASSTS